VPSQFQLRDLINHVVIGAVILLLLPLFLHLLSPQGWITLAGGWHAVQAEVNVALLLPLLLIITYVIGAMVPGSRSLLLFKEPTSVLVRALRVCRIITAPEAPATGLIERLFTQKAAKLFASQDTDPAFDDLFRLAQAVVLTAAPSMEQLDIERHFILMHFNAKLCLLFFVCMLIAAFGVLWPPTHGRLTFLVVSALCYAIAWSCGRKAQANQRHWQALIIRSFIVTGLARSE
jgi:hypothetical protein